MNDHFQNIEIYTQQEHTRLQDVAWQPHAACPGVSLKHYITGSMTDGKFSCHLVRVQAGCEISEHIHAANWELHEVISGKGSGELDGQRLAYEAGVSIVIPQGTAHRVNAETEDVYLWAKFVPALL